MRTKSTLAALRGATLPVIAGLLAALALHAVAMPPAFAWVGGVLVAAVALLVRIRMPDDSRMDAPAHGDQGEHRGSQVSRLAWAINPETGTAGEAVTRRVRAILQRRLARAGIDVATDTARVERHLGPGLWARLQGRDVRVDDIRAALEVAERLRRLPQQDGDSPQTQDEQKESTA
ncbi:hypothetical protein [Microbacterium sp. USHLN186]|uniref:hypothetical protein n=1 Tax=Microbacterium sp. USHLN186 TaxID=3081286 RepID=UPI003019300A